MLVLVLAVLTVSYASSMRAYLEQRSQIDALRATIADAQGNISRLQREKRRWHDKAYVEQQARERFGFVMPGEVGYQVIGLDGKPLDRSTSLSDPGQASDPVTRPAWWQSAWGSVEAAGNPEANTPAPVDEIRAPSPKKKR